MNSNGMELEQVVHTRWTSCRSGLPGEFGGLNPRSNSCRAFISVSVGSTLLSYLFTTATVQICQILGGRTAPKYGTKPLRYYVTRRFRDRRGTALTVTEIEPKLSPLLCVNRGPIQCDFRRAGAKVIQYSMNIALIQRYSSFQRSSLTRHPSLAPANE